MSITSTFSMLNTQKRKRTVLSYAQLDPLADLMSDDEDITAVPHYDSSDDESDNDDRTYSGRKKTPKKIKKNKKARHILACRQPEQKPFPFMQLPPELRDMIYEIALTEADGISIVSKTKAYRRTVCRAANYDSDSCRYLRQGTTCQTTGDKIKMKVLVPKLLAVSKQIHNETINMLYGHDFAFEDTDALHRFLVGIGPRNQQRLRRIEVKSFCTGRNTRAINHCAFMSLAGATNLKTLILNNYEFRHCSSPKGLARSIYSNAHSFLEAYGAAHGRKDAAIDIIELDEDLFDSFYSYRRHVDGAKQATFEENQAVYRAELCRLLGAQS